MSFISTIKNIFFPLKEQEPGPAYDQWAAGYDNQPGNLMLDLDEAVFSSLLADTAAGGKPVVDIGCGTGRHWSKLFEQVPARLVGYDVSAGMLQKLKEKYPKAETFLLKKDRLPELPASSCELLISTLALAHIEDIVKAWSEWNRVLKPGAELIITDYHPQALAKGGKRTFRHNGKTMAVKNYIHSIDKVRLLAGQLGWKELRYTQRVIDDSVKGYYEQQQALHLFESYYNVPIIYGIHLKKADDPA